MMAHHTFETRFRAPLLGTVLFVGFFAGLLWLLRDVMNAVLAVLKVTHGY